MVIRLPALGMSAPPLCLLAQDPETWPSVMSTR